MRRDGPPDFIFGSELGGGGGRCGSLLIAGAVVSARSGDKLMIDRHLSARSGRDGWEG